MAEKYLCILAEIDVSASGIPEALQKRLFSRGFRGTQTMGIPMHITMGTFPCNEQADLVRRVTASAEHTPPFGIEYTHLGIFGHGGKVLFAAPDRNRELLSLRERFGPSDGWTPHTTLLIDEPGIIADAVREISQVFDPFTATVEALSLYEFFPSRLICRCRLGGNHD